MMVLLLSSVAFGILCGRFLSFEISDTAITVILMLLVFVVGIEIGSEEGILKRMKINIPVILVQSVLVICGTLLFSGITSFFTGFSFKEAMGASAGMGWYSLSGIMISELYSPFLGAVSFTSNIIREVASILIIPIFARFSQLGAISSAGATSMDTLLGLISKNTDKDSTLIAFGQGVILSLSVPLIISVIFGQR